MRHVSSLKTAVESSRFDVTPGVPCRIEIAVTNTAEVIDGYQLIIDGLDPAHIRQDEPVISLFPDAAGVVSFEVDLPASFRAGHYLVTVQVASTVDADRESAHDLWLTVAPVEQASVSVVPSVVTKGRKASVEATVKNTGNTPTVFVVGALDQERELDCRAEPKELSIEPGESATTRIEMRGPRPMTGSPARRQLKVSARSEHAEDEADLTFHQRPWIPRGLLTFLILALIVAIWAIIFFWVIRGIRSTDALGKEPAKGDPVLDADGRSQLATGELNISIAQIAAVVSGNVVSSSEEEPLPRITVEAYRIVPPGEGETDSTLRLTSAAATDDEGAYRMAGLLPGSYRIQFSGEGFVGEAVDLAEPLAARQLLGIGTMKMTGEPGSIRGTLVLPEGSTASFAATATRIVDDELLPPQPPVVFQGADFVIPKLVTPARYRIRIEPVPLSAVQGFAGRPRVGEGDAAAAAYAPIVLEAELGGGQDVVLNPVRPTTTPSSIVGSVVDGNGNPVGGAMVVITGVDYRKEIVTPTNTAVGTFVVGALPAPADYVIEFSKDGFQRQTIAVSLKPGENKPVTGELIGGSGRISGTVGLGGVGITVEGNGFSATTTSLTTEPVGSYGLSSIPVPGVYTVTFRLTGYETATHLIEFCDASSPNPSATCRSRIDSGAELTVLSGIDAALVQSVGTIEGVIRVDVTGSGTSELDQLAMLKVELSNGIDKRETKLATSPLGSYSFTEVPVGSYTVVVYRQRKGLDDEVVKVLLRSVDAGETVTASAVVAASQSASAPATTTSATTTTSTTTTVVPTTTSTTTTTTTSTTSTTTTVAVTSTTAVGL